MSEDIINRRAIQWFPGHMAKTLRLMETEIRNVDCVLQILDARIPLSSLNPEIERITSGKPSENRLLQKQKVPLILANKTNNSYAKTFYAAIFFFLTWHSLIIFFSYIC